MQMSQEPESSVTYAIGDIHGEVTLLRELLALLPYREADTLVVIGDYVDRGEDSIATIHALRELQRHHARCVFLRGNHEDAWLHYWDGLRFSRPPDIEGAEDVWDACKGRVPFVVGDWLEQTQIDYEDAHAYYVHAGVKPGVPLWRTADFQTMWGVQGFLESDYVWGKPIVFGHTPFSELLLQPNKIGIDTGAYRTGILTAVCLPNRTIFQARRKGYSTDKGD